VEALLDTQGVHIVQRQSCIAVCESAGEAESKACKMGRVHAKFYICNKTHFRTANKVADALSRKCLLLQEFRVKTLGFENLKDMYAGDADFGEAYEAAENPVLRDRSPWIDYLIQDGFLFKGNQLCIPDCSMRENLVKEKHSGGLAGHFGHDKTFAKLSELYF
jgi:hypothetical protein